MARAIVAVSNLKGGAGKTLLAVHLAFHLEGLIVDLDPQGDASDWATRSGLVEAVHAFKVGEDHFDMEKARRIIQGAAGPVILDTPPGEGEPLRLALALSDIVIVPVKAGAGDLRALGRMQTLTDYARKVNPGLRLAVVLNEAKVTATLTATVQTALQELKGATFLGHLGDRVAFPEAYAAGTVVHSGPGAEEIEVLVRNLTRLIKRSR